ncbi:MAG: hypothetical protein ACMXYL_03925, partial [Candidatus Woesearchaeota archaeon]
MMKKKKTVKKKNVAKKKPARKASRKKMPSRKKHHTSLYAGIYDKEEVRKSLLEAMKETIIILQRYQKIAVMREQRIILEEEMKKIFSGMSENLSDFRSTLPELPKQEKPKRERIRLPKPIKFVPEKPDLKEIDKLLEAPLRNKTSIGGLGHEFDNLGKKLLEIDKKLR